MSVPKELKYIVPTLNKSSTTLTDCFCVVGCNSNTSDDEDNLIFGSTTPIGCTYDGINFFFCQL
jgi:hypothetical protein